MSSISIPRWAGRALVAVIALAALLIIFRLGSQASAGVALNDPVVWVEDGQNGRLLQINGSTREITAQVEVGDDNDSIVALPRGRDAVFLNRTTGVVGVVGAVSLAIDQEDDQPGQSGVVGEQLEFLADHGNDEWVNAYIIDTDRALVVDPGRSQRLDIPIPQGQALSDTVIDAQGRLLAITGDSSQVGISTDRGLEQLVSLAPVIDSSAPTPELVRAGDSIYVVDISRRVVNEIFDNGELGTDSTVCGSPDEVHVAGNVLNASDGVHRIVVHDGPDGTLSVTEPSTGDCVVIELDVEGSNFGEPVVVDATAYLPNYESGEIIVVDLEDRVVVDSFRFRPATGRAFELEVFDGAVWANEPDGFRAAIVSRDALEPISKLGDFVVGGELVEDGDGSGGFTGGEGEDGPRVFNEDGAVFGVDGNGGELVDGFVQGGPGVDADDEDATATIDDEEADIAAVDGDLDEVTEVADEPDANAPIVDEEVSDQPLAAGDLIPVDPLPSDVVVPVEEEQPAPLADELIANFTFSSDTISVGEEVRLTDDSGGTPTSWNWDFGDATSASGPDVRKIWDNPGNYTVTLFVANAQGELAQQSHTFQVIAEDVLRIPSAGFTLSSSVVEVGEPVTFINTSTGEPETLLWEFGDGDTGSGEEVTHSFSEPGVYSVTLTASNAAGPNSVTAQVEVVAGVEPPVAVIAQFPGVVEAGQIITLTSASTNSPTSTSWDFGDDATATGDQVRHSWDEAGTYRIRLAVSNSAGASEAFADIVVEPRVNPPIARFNQSSALAIVGEAISFSDLSLNAPTTLTWDFGDDTTATGANVTHTWDTPGTYLVTLTAANDAGTDTTTKQVTIEPIPVDPPTAAFTASDLTVPVNQVVTFTDTSTGSPTEWSWNFGDGSALSTAPNPNHAFAQPGTYTVTLTVENPGGSTSTSQQITVIDPPTASFTQSIDELDVSFTDTSENGPTSWVWDFGDGSTSTDQNPDHTYATPGPYTVTLTTSNDAGDSIPFDATFTVSQAPTADFSEIVSGLTAQFTDLSTEGPATWSWDFGDGSSSTSQNPSHTYDLSGTYNVVLTVTNGAGSDSTSEQVTVELAPPEAIFTCTVVGGGVSCNGTSSTSAVSYLWDAGGGTILGGQGTPNVSINFTATDDYDITLTVENIEGTPDSATETISVTVQQPPVVTGVSVASDDGNGLIGLVASATENPTGWTWTTGGGTITAGAGTASPTIQYNVSGDKTVTVVASNGAGSSTPPEPFTFTVNIAPPDPVINSLGQSPTATPGVVDLSANVTNVTNYNWSIVSGPAGASLSSSTAAAPTLTATANGSYNISLVVDNGGATTDSDSITVVVGNIPDPPPVINSITPSPTATPGVVDLSANVTNVATYAWSITGGPAGASLAGPTSPTPTLTATQNGMYTVSLQVDNGSGQTVSSSTTVNITNIAPPIPAPTGSFSVSLTAPSTVATFSFTGSVDAASVTYAWTVDGVPVGGSSATISYDFSTNPTPPPGSYQVALTVTDAGGTLVLPAQTVNVA